MLNFRKKSFAKLYDKQVDKIYRFIFLKTGSVEVSQDLTSQVFSKGWQRFRLGGKIKNPSAYLFQIARAETANYFRAKDKYKIIPADYGVIADPSMGLEETQALGWDIKILRENLSLLNEESQNLLIWRYADNLSIKQVAVLAERPQGTVRVMIHRAIKELKERMRD